MSGEAAVLGFTLLSLSIGNIESRVLALVIDIPCFKYDFVIGLDLIPTFKLSVSENLVVSQGGSSLLSLSSVSSNSIPVLTALNVIRSVEPSFMNSEMLPDKLSHLHNSQRDSLFNLICKFSSSFANHAFDVGNVQNHECRIELNSTRYISKKPYRCTFADQDEIDRQVNELLTHGLISESRSPFASPVTMQFKKAGLGPVKTKTRMCVDYRELNKIVVPENQPFPLIDEIITRSRGCSYYSALDINAAFWSIPIRAEDRHKTAFITQRGIYEWSTMPFGLKTAPACFQRILSGVLHRRKLTNFCVNYLDDILVFSHTFEEHLTHLSLLMQAIFEEGFRLSFKKCTFAVPRINYLGHVLTSDSVLPLHDNLAAIQLFPTPSTRRHVRQFLGKINFYRKFIPRSTVILEPFHLLLRKNSKFFWSSECQRSFDVVKRLLTSAPVLAIFDRERPTFIYTDASGIGVAGVLKQMQADGSERPVAYFSKKLSDSQRRQKAIYIEALAIREAIRYWRYWLLGISFTVVTDHKPLEHLNLKARTDEELGDLAHELLQFDFKVVYRPGVLNSEADCLSRNPVLPPMPENVQPAPILRSFNFLTLDDIRLNQSPLPPSPSDSVENGIVIHNRKDSSPFIRLSCSFGEHLARVIHVRFGHVGAPHVISIIRKFFRFDSMYATIRKVCHSCDVCNRNKTRRSRRAGKLGLFGPASRPYEIMSLDTVGGFGGNGSPKRYLHLLVDHFTRFAYILCSSGQSTRDFISLVDSVHSKNPIGTLLTDQYGGLSSDEFASYCSSNSISHIFVAVDSAFSNGLNERTGQTVVNRVRCARNDPSTPSRAWPVLASKCIDDYNNSPHSVTGFAPAYLLHGSSRSIIPDSLFPPSDLVADRKLALDRTLKYHSYNKNRYDASKSDVIFSLGDLVYVDNGSKLNRVKLDPVRLGPFRISRCVSDSIYEIDFGTGGRFSTRHYHISKLLHAL